MDPKHLTVVAVLVAALVVVGVVQIVTAVRLYAGRAGYPRPRLLLIGLAAAVGTHLAIVGLTGSMWAGIPGVLPFAVAALTCVPNPWERPPRRARTAADVQYGSAPVHGAGMVGGAEPWPSSKIEPDQDTGRSDPLSASEQQAWESIRRGYDET